jgi:hypothetical protein
MNSLTMPLWQQLLLLFAIPVVIGMAVLWWKVATVGRQGSSKPLRKRKRKRH